MKHLAFLFVLCAATVAGCGEPESSSPGRAATPAPATNALADTEWRLVEIQSMDDSQGTSRPGDSSLYTMRLNGDGTVAMRLNCNRASGTWSTTPGPEPGSGGFEFGPLAGTRALCPPPSLDERITAQAQYVRSYLLKDGRLHLSLMADGGIEVWEPAPAGATAASAPEAARSAQAATLPETVVDLLKKDYTSADMPPSRYLAGTSDLNGDGQAELLVHVVGPMACGSGGCPTLVLTPQGADYRLVTTITVSRPPIRVSTRSTNGWRNLIVEVSGGGGRSGHAELAFTGKGYPRNPTVPPAQRITDLTGAETVIKDFSSFEEATPLPPN